MFPLADSIQQWNQPAANDNARRPITTIEPIPDSRPPPAGDPFEGDVAAWLAWLSDCTVIESSIRRGLDHALGLDALGAGPDQAWGSDPDRPDRE